MKILEILNEMPRVPYNDIEDEMGGEGSKWEQRQHREQRSKENEWRATESVKELAHKISAKVSQVYDSLQHPYINYNVRTVSVKLGGIKGRNFYAPAVEELNAWLKEQFLDEITVRRVGLSTVQYHIPYDIFDDAA